MSVKTVMVNISIVAQWVEPQLNRRNGLRNLAWILTLPFWSIGSFFTQHCTNSLGYINEYLAIETGGYLCTFCLQAVIYTSSMSKSQLCRRALSSFDLANDADNS